MCSDVHALFSMLSCSSCSCFSVHASSFFHCSTTNHHQTQVHLVPGSVEQRGTDVAAALAGRRPFCRALSYGGASLLLTAQLGEVFLEGAAAAGRWLRLGLKAAGEGGVANTAAARVLPGGREVQLGEARLPELQVIRGREDDMR